MFGEPHFTAQESGFPNYFASTGAARILEDFCKDDRSGCQADDVLFMATKAAVTLTYMTRLDPEENFGDFISNHVSYGEMSTAAFNAMAKATFGSDKKQLGGDRAFHAMDIAWQFYPIDREPYIMYETFGFNYTTELLAKFLVYNEYVKARSAKESKTVESLVMEEVNKFKYKKKASFKEPQFSDLVLAKNRNAENDEFHLGLTDKGLCYVYNGDVMQSTYKETARTKELERLFETRKEANLTMISNSGKAGEKIFWFDAGAKDLRKNKRAAMTVALNEWLNYFNVRINQIELKAGMEMVITIDPTVHTLTENFKYA